MTKVTYDKLFLILQEEDKTRANFLVAADFLKENDEEEMSEGLKYLIDNKIYISYGIKQFVGIYYLSFCEEIKTCFLLIFKEYWNNFELTEIFDTNHTTSLRKDIFSVKFSSKLEAIMAFLFVWKKNYEQIILKLFLYDNQSKS